MSEGLRTMCMELLRKELKINARKWTENRQNPSEGKVKSIKTIYKNIYFRSRLEARYAVLFDLLGIKWIYEQKGYQFSDGTKYLPDFYFPDDHSFFEAKGIMNEKDMDKITHLINDCGSKVIIGYQSFHFQVGEAQSYSGGIETEDWSFLALCESCGKYSFHGSLLTTCPTCNSVKMSVVANGTLEFKSSIIENLLNKAICFQFDHVTTFDEPLFLKTNHHEITVDQVIKDFDEFF